MEYTTNEVQNLRIALNRFIKESTPHTKLSNALAMVKLAEDYPEEISEEDRKYLVQKAIAIYNKVEIAENGRSAHTIGNTEAAKGWRR